MEPRDESHRSGIKINSFEKSTPLVPTRSSSSDPQDKGVVCDIAKLSSLRSTSVYSPKVL